MAEKEGICSVCQSPAPIEEIPPAAHIRELLEGVVELNVRQEISPHLGPGGDPCSGHGTAPEAFL